MGKLLKEMGQRMLDRRKQLRLTQETLAKMAHVTPQTISTAELGTKAMRPETILNVCEALDISTDYLLRGRVIEDDARLLHQKISSLTPSQYHVLDGSRFITLLLFSAIFVPPSEIPKIIRCSPSSQAGSDCSSPLRIPVEALLKHYPQIR